MLSILAQDYTNAEGNVRFEAYRTEDNPATFLTFLIFENEDYYDQFVESGGYENYKEALPTNPWEVPPNITWLKRLDKFGEKNDRRNISD